MSTIKKLKPKILKVKKSHRIFYGSNMNSSSKSYNKKTNMICPNENCGYSSRSFIWTFRKAFEYLSSTKCPIHGDLLINIGNGSKLLKKGSKERKNLIKLYK